VGQTFCDIFDIALVPKTPVGRQSAHASWGVLLGKVPVWGCVLLADHAVVCVTVPSHRVRSCCRGKQAATVDGGAALACGRAWSVCVRVLYQRGILINRVESKGNNPGDAVWSCLLSNAVDRGQWQCPVSRASCLCFCLCAGCCCGDGCACRRVSDSLSELSPLDVVVRPYFRLLFLPWGFITCVLQPRSDQIAISTFRGSRPRIA
jgi:hypothetical protein